jgi:anthranilate phosphoribosyltransferase
MNLTSETLTRLLRGVSLTRSEATEVLASVLRGEVEPAVIASFLTLLAQRGETVEEMTGFVDAMVGASESVDVPVEAMDIVGTGGDRTHSVNVSTMAALTVAACGIPVAKHGNRAASSSVGTADVLEGIGVKIDIDGATVARCVREAGMGFFFAQRFHPGLRHLGPIRRALGVPTAFNVLGPLANPGHVQRLLIGVANGEMMPKMASVVVARNIEKATLLHSDDGLDELSLGSPATLVEVAYGEISTRRLDAGEVLGVRHTVDQIRGGDLATNVGLLEEFVGGKEGAVFDVVTANAALALCVAGVAPTLGDGFDLSRAAVREGGAAKVLQRLIAVSNGLSPSSD